MIQTTITTQQAPDLVLTTPAGPWRRFSARIFDIYVSVFLLGVLGALTLGNYSSIYVQFMNGANNEIVIGFLFLPVALALDALICHLFGTNLGKYIFGVKVVKMNGELIRKMDFKDWLIRAFNVWKSGMGFGIPFVNLVTTIREKNKLGKLQLTTYDQRCGFQVYGETLSFIRKLFGSVIAIAVFGIMIVSIIWSKQIGNNAVNVSTAPPYSWQNPNTRIESIVSSDWTHSSKANAQGNDAYIFTDSSKRAVVVLGIETVESNLNNYVRVFQNETRDKMVFTDGGRYFDKDGVQVWEGQGSMKFDPNMRLSVEVRKNKNNYWRIVTLQTRPYDLTDLKVQALSTSLWKSITFETNQGSPAKKAD